MINRRNAATRDVIAALRKDGRRVHRQGPGDHVRFKHPSKPGKVTVDAGEPAIPIGTLRSIDRAAEVRGETRSCFLVSAAKARLAGE